MQQTEKYKLNKPEGDDPLAIAPLNENMDKLEAAIDAGDDAVRAEAAAGDAAEAKARADADSAEAKARADADSAEAKARASADTAEAKSRANADTALEKRIAALEAKHAVGGSYKGNGGTQTIKLGFTPAVVLIYVSPLTGVIFRKGGSTSTYPQVTDGGFILSGTSYNSENNTYTYIAIA